MLHKVAPVGILQEKCHVLHILLPSTLLFSLFLAKCGKKVQSFPLSALLKHSFATSPKYKSQFFDFL